MTTSRSTILALAAVAAVVPAAVAGAQDPGPMPNPDAPPLGATLKAPSKVSKATLKKGMSVTVTCDRACNARLMLAGRVGIVTQKSGQVASSKTFKVKAMAFQVREMDKGDVYTLSVDARADDGALKQLSKKIKIK